MVMVLTADDPGESSGCPPILRSLAELDGFGQRIAHDYNQVVVNSVSIFVLGMQLLILCMFVTLAFFHQELASTIKGELFSIGIQLTNRNNLYRISKQLVRWYDCVFGANYCRHNGSNIFSYDRLHYNLLWIK